MQIESIKTQLSMEKQGSLAETSNKLLTEATQLNSDLRKKMRGFKSTPLYLSLKKSTMKAKKYIKDW